MAEQSEHDKPQNLVEASQELEEEAARSLQDAADSNATLQGYYSINDQTPSEEALEADKNKPAGERKSDTQSAGRG